jgi:diketogulonate reductase-like aldo/keto reductase
VPVRGQGRRAGAGSRRRVARVEENTAADTIQLSDDQLDRLSNLTPPAGERHDEANMASVDR